MWLVPRETWDVLFNEFNIVITCLVAGDMLSTLVSMWCPTFLHLSLDGMLQTSIGDTVYAKKSFLANLLWNGSIFDVIHSWILTAGSWWFRIHPFLLHNPYTTTQIRVLDVKVPWLPKPSEQAFSLFFGYFLKTLEGTCTRACTNLPLSNLNMLRTK